jgi:hypothetical protein
MKRTLLSVVLLAQPFFTAAFAATSADLVAHEWGTFTSVQGSNGVLLQWNPFTTTHLPDFVYSRARPVRREEMTDEFEVLGLTGKGGSAWLQRMETPVIYFYSDREQAADVAVDFPEGQITEWYPQVTDFGPKPALGQLLPATQQSRLRWDRLTIAPAPEEEGSAGEKSEATVLPKDSSGSHYFAARETDAALVRPSQGLLARPEAETEKFLFYRGVGNFAAPLNVHFQDGALVLANNGREELADLFVLAVRPSGAAFVSVHGLKSGEQRKVEIESEAPSDSVSGIVGQLAAVMEGTLVNAGLYPREAAAMVKTWRESWFDEPGLRVLYLLPRAWTDHILPLSITPTPSELVRVMVGRAEMFSPAIEQRLREQFTLFNDSATHDQAVAGVGELGLGRFVEAAMRRLAELEIRQIHERVAKLEGQLRPKVVARK